MRRRFRRRSYTPLAVVLLLLVVVLVRWAQEASRTSPPEALVAGNYEVERVVDGDTLLLANGARVRLIGVDTPETVKPETPVEPFGPEASEFTRQFIAEGNGQVRLELDKERQDRYGRFLAYVFVGEKMLNEQLLLAGLARARTEFRYSETRKRQFRNAQRQAREAGRGIWGEPAAPGTSDRAQDDGHRLRGRRAGAKMGDSRRGPPVWQGPAKVILFLSRNPQ